MQGLIMYMYDVKKEIFFGLSITVLYLTYYLMEVVKRPVVVGGSAALRTALGEVRVLHDRYWPTPWLVEARLQTVLGSLLRTACLRAPAFRRQLLRLRDGGLVALDWLDDGREPARGAPVLLVLPGLTGCAHADYVRCLCAAAAALGAHCVVYTYRGLGGVPLVTPRLYCALSTADLAEVIDAVRARHDGPLLAAGVSLGGLILGNYLAERGAATPVAAALGVSVPLDVERGAASLDRPVNAPLSRLLARRLRGTLRAHASLAAPHWPAVAASRSVRQFDAAFTATHFGFASVDEYYRAATLRGKLNRVRVPLLCLQAADDPFQPADALPTADAAGGRVALAVLARGGHIGFLEGWWPARAAADQLLARLAHQYFAAILRRPALLHREVAAAE